MSDDPLVWERVEWRQGDGRYRFEVERGGLHATLTAPHGSSLTLPMVAWEGLLDAFGAARKTKSRHERAFPPRSGARWYEGEAGELATAFRAGRSIAPAGPRPQSHGIRRRGTTRASRLVGSGRAPARTGRRHAGHQGPPQTADDEPPFPSRPRSGLGLQPG